MRRLSIVAVTGVVLLSAAVLSAGRAFPMLFEAETAEQNPWTHLEFLAKPEHFQFAIVTDRTGGHRAMVFEKAVQKLNTLRPEFVISVGDLIEGYSKDPAAVAKEWDEFQAFVGKLDMPFFYAPGNHDLSNPAMLAEWNKRFGRPYYHFLYRNTLFLVLSSESEPGADDPTLGAEQLSYLRQVLAENRNVRWTFLFLHRPLWSYGPDQQGEGTGWPELEQALAGRKFTAFCGHHHRYQTWERNGNRYIQLATTGGASKMRGKEVGEFDQIAWITMTDNGPVLANVLLDGIVDFDVRSDLDYDRKMKDVQAIQEKQREEARKKREAAKKKAAAKT